MGGQQLGTGQARVNAVANLTAQQNNTVSTTISAPGKSNGQQVQNASDAIKTQFANSGVQVDAKGNIVDAPSFLPTPAESAASAGARAEFAANHGIVESTPVGLPKSSSPYYAGSSPSGAPIGNNYSLSLSDSLGITDPLVAGFVAAPIKTPGLSGIENAKNQTLDALAKNAALVATDIENQNKIAKDLQTKIDATAFSINQAANTSPNLTASDFPDQLRELTGYRTDFNNANLKVTYDTNTLGQIGQQKNAYENYFNTVADTTKKQSVIEASYNTPSGGILPPLAGIAPSRNPATKTTTAGSFSDYPIFTTYEPTKTTTLPKEESNISLPTPGFVPNFGETKITTLPTRQSNISLPTPGFVPSFNTTKTSPVLSNSKTIENSYLKMSDFGNPNTFRLTTLNFPTVGTNETIADKDTSGLIDFVVNAKAQGVQTIDVLGASRINGAFGSNGIKIGTTTPDNVFADLKKYQDQGIAVTLSAVIPRQENEAVSFLKFPFAGQKTNSEINKTELPTNARLFFSIFSGEEKTPNNIYTAPTFGTKIESPFIPDNTLKIGSTTILDVLQFTPVGSDFIATGKSGLSRLSQIGINQKSDLQKIISGVMSQEEKPLLFGSEKVGNKFYDISIGTEGTQSKAVNNKVYPQPEGNINPNLETSASLAKEGEAKTPRVFVGKDIVGIVPSKINTEIPVNSILLQDIYGNTAKSLGLKPVEGIANLYFGKINPDNIMIIGNAEKTGAITRQANVFQYPKEAVVKNADVYTAITQAPELIANAKLPEIVRPDILGLYNVESKGFELATEIPGNVKSILSNPEVIERGGKQVGVEPIGSKGADAYLAEFLNTQFKDVVDPLTGEKVTLRPFEFGTGTTGGRLSKPFGTETKKPSGKENTGSNAKTVTQKTQDELRKIFEANQKKANAKNEATYRKMYGLGGATTKTQTKKESSETKASKATRQFVENLQTQRTRRGKKQIIESGYETIYTTRPGSTFENDLKNIGKSIIDTKSDFKIDFGQDTKQETQPQLGVDIIQIPRLDIIPKQGTTPRQTGTPRQDTTPKQTPTPKLTTTPTLIPTIPTVEPPPTKLKTPVVIPPIFKNIFGDVGGGEEKRGRKGKKLYVANDITNQAFGVSRVGNQVYSEKELDTYRKVGTTGKNIYDKMISGGSGKKSRKK